MSSGAIAVLIAPQRYKDRNLLCAEVSQTTMSSLRKILITLLSASLLGSFAGAGQALASHTQTTYFEGSAELLSPLTRPHAIEQLQHLGVHALRIEIPWANVTQGPENAAEPSFEAANPASYNWGEYGALIAEANRLRWPVLLTVTAPAPRWATANHLAPYITRPDDQDFQEFMTAVGREFASRVSLFAIWNEPNHPAYLLPQWNSNGTPASPRIYRGLYQAAYAGLQAAGIARPKVLFGETEATGYDKINVRREGASALEHDVAPLLFLREALCLNSKYKRSGSCSELQMTGYSHHAYSKPVGPYYKPPEADDVTIGVLSRLSHALDLAARAHAIPAGLPIYLTEFGVQSYPNKQLGVSPAKQVEYDAISEHIAYSNPRVAAFSQYLLKDDPTGGAPGASARGGFIGFQSGLEYESGAPKPLYYAWPIPLTVTKLHHGVALWGLARPTTGATKVTVLVRAKGSKRYRTLRTISTNSFGYWSFNSTTAGQYWRVRWTSPAGVKYEGPAIQASAAG
jgi:hypothetical protein